MIIYNKLLLRKVVALAPSGDAGVRTGRADSGSSGGSSGLSEISTHSVPSWEALPPLPSPKEVVDYFGTKPITAHADQFQKMLVKVQKLGYEIHKHEHADMVDPHVEVALITHEGGGHPSETRKTLHLVLARIIHITFKTMTECKLKAA